jgi:phosphatidylserine/phosphatidylglycerophosphate/cardiolipin synthase-like enzyme
LIELRTLTDGGQAPESVAAELATFLDGAERSLDIAIYDVKLDGPAEQTVLGSLVAARERGVTVRLAFNFDHPGHMKGPPPPATDPDLLAALPVETRPIPGIPDLMHHKYAIRDGAAVWTGSLNWTDDSWSRQENVVVVVHSTPIAKAFTIDFDQLWTTADVMRTGFVDPRWDDGVRAWFTPGHGEDLSARIAKQIHRAKRRVRICSPVITTGPVLGTLAQVIADGRVDVAGCVDVTQIREVIQQWHANANVSWKLPLLERVLAGPFTGKESTPYGAGTVHDFMHAKVTVCDDTVFVGSFNLSRSGEKNAENVLEIEDAAIAERLAGFVDEVRARYPAVTIAPSAPDRPAPAAAP